MTSERYFSGRNDLWKPETGLVRQNIPNQIRNFARTFIQESSKYVNRLWWSATVSLDLEPTNYHDDGMYMGSTQEALNTEAAMEYLRVCDYGDFLNLCEAIYDYFTGEDYERSEYFLNQLNERLLRYYSSYRMDATGRVVEAASQPGEQASEEARAILRSPKFEGPDRQFQNALMNFHRVSSPDYEGAVAGALNAVEAVARIVLGDDSIALGAAVPKIRDEKELHPRLANSIQSLYDYASDEGGRHGLTGSPDADRVIAEFCLHHAAASIVLIARLYGHDVVEGM